MTSHRPTRTDASLSYTWRRDRELSAVTQFVTDTLAIAISLVNEVMCHLRSLLCLNFKNAKYYPPKFFSTYSNLPGPPVCQAKIPNMSINRSKSGSIGSSNMFFGECAISSFVNHLKTGSFGRFIV